MEVTNSLQTRQGLTWIPEEVTNSPQTSQDFIWIPEEVQYHINLWLVIIVRSVLSLFGVISNVVNLRIFYTLGMKERVNFTLFILSAIDFGYCLFTLATSVDFTFIFYNIDETVTQHTVLEVLYIIRACFIDCSSLLVAFISIERCFCVTLPFTFSIHFNARKTKTTIATIIIFILMNYFPFLISVKMKEVTDLKTNKTIFTYEITEFFLIMANLNNYLLGILLAVFCQVSVFVCAVLMHRGLQKSSLVRKSVGHVKSSRPDNTDSEKSTTGNLGLMSGKERRIIKMVIILACLYVPTSLPQIALAFALLLYPDLMVGPLVNVYTISSGLMTLCCTANGSLTIFIYYKYNTNFRKTLLQKIFKLHVL
ncbi:probable G-protein coupled receptor AH9.1 [Physella acuta]|uniref:probable G-protein coupled receptor AH9.1 n=1 Tax=Physella acuta TaxID=109671 RepID=UPI0027DB5BFC|nr:probable G-protein coupled receptor AH9.1 [Physella acuta]